MNKTLKRIFAVLAVIFMLTATCVPAFAADADEPTAAATEEVASEDKGVSAKAISAAIIIAFAASAGAIAMAIAIKSSAEGMAKQPEAISSIRSAMMLGLVFIETAIIYALIVAILVVFVL